MRGLMRERIPVLRSARVGDLIGVFRGDVFIDTRTINRIEKDILIDNLGSRWARNGRLYDVRESGLLNYNARPHKPPQARKVIPPGA